MLIQLKKGRENIIPLDADDWLRHSLNEGPLNGSLSCGWYHERDLATEGNKQGLRLKRCSCVSSKPMTVRIPACPHMKSSSGRQELACVMNASQQLCFSAGAGEKITSWSLSIGLRWQICTRDLERPHFILRKTFFHFSQ